MEDPQEEGVEELFLQDHLMEKQQQLAEQNPNNNVTLSMSKCLTLFRSKCVRFST